MNLLIVPLCRGGGSVEASSNDKTVSSDDQNPESDVSDKQSNDVDLNETSDESNSDAAESGVYQVNDQLTFEAALNKISSDNLSEIRLVLKGGSSFVVPTQEDNVSNFGVANKKITVTSDGDNHATLRFSSRAMLSGPCTFDNVEVVGLDKFYCNGFDTVFTRNCELKLSRTLYGGGYKSTVDHTHVVIAASGYINPGSGAGLHDVIGGSYQGSVEHDTYLEISGNLGMASGNHVNPGCMRGDGSSGDGNGSPAVYVGGNATLVYDNANSEVSPSIEGTYGCEMRGNVTLDVRSGRVNEICGHFGDPAPIKGNIHIIAGSSTYENTDKTLRLNGNWSITGAGQMIPDGVYEVDGDVVIDAYENVWGWDKGGSIPNDVPYIEGSKKANVGGSISVNVHGSHVGSIYGAEWSAVNGDIAVNASGVELRDEAGDSHGYVFCENDLTNSSDEGSSVKARGKLSISLNSGSVGYVSLTSNKNVSISDGSFINITGRPEIATGVTGVYYGLPKGSSSPTINIAGTVAEIPYIKYASALNVTDKSEITAGTISSVNKIAITGQSNTNVTTKFGCNNASSYELIEDNGLRVDEGSVLTTAGSQAYVYGYADINGTWEQQYNTAKNYNDIFVKGTTSIGSKGILIDHGSSNLKGAVINKGTLALMAPALFQGNYRGDDAEIRLPAVTNNYDGTDDGGDIPLIVKGESSGKTTVNTVDPNNWQNLKLPSLGDNYVLSKASGDAPKQSTFILGNEDAVGEGYYLKRVRDADGTDDFHMWQVAAKLSLTFDDNGAGDSAYPQKFLQDKTADKDSFTFALPKTAPTRKGWAFDGWNTERDGSGDQFTDKTEVSKSTTVYAQWKWVPRDVTVTFDENGGETKADPASQTKTTEPGALASTGERLLPVLPLAVVGSALTSLGLLLECNRKKRRNDK